jgi:hypothetical protein
MVRVRKMVGVINKLQENTSIMVFTRQIKNKGTVWLNLYLNKKILSIKDFGSMDLSKVKVAKFNPMESNILVPG